MQSFLSCTVFFCLIHVFGIIRLPEKCLFYEFNCHSISDLAGQSHSFLGGISSTMWRMTLSPSTRRRLGPAVPGWALPGMFPYYPRDLSSSEKRLKKDEWMHTLVWRSLKQLNLKLQCGPVIPCRERYIHQ